MEATKTEMLMVDVDAKVSFKSLDLAIGTLTDAPGLPTYSGVVKSIFSPRTGKFALVVDEYAIHLVDTQSCKEKLQLLESNISQIMFSPLENYFVTASKFNAQNNPKNLVVWNLQGEPVAKFEWKRHAKEFPQFFKFSEAEEFCARQSGPNCIELYQNSDFTQTPLIVKQQIQVSRKGNPKPLEDGVQMQFHGFQWVETDKKKFLFTWQNANVEGKGGNFFIYDIPTKVDKPKFSIQCEKANEITPLVSKDAFAFLLWQQNYVDESFQSYYGHHRLQYIQLLGGRER